MIVKSSPPPASGSTAPVSPPLDDPRVVADYLGSAIDPVEHDLDGLLRGDRASSSTGARGVPAQRALPMRPVTTGKPWLPEHSSVKSTSRRGRACSSASVSDRRPGNQAGDAYAPAARVQATGGYAVVSDVMELLGRGQPGVELLPDELASGNIRGGRPRAVGRATGGPRRRAVPVIATGQAGRHPTRVALDRRRVGRRGPGRPPAATALPAPHRHLSTTCAVKRLDAIPAHRERSFRANVNTHSDRW